MENDFQFRGVDYDYDDYSCDGAGGTCGCVTGDDYCRNSTYNGLRASPIVKDIAASLCVNGDSGHCYAVDRLVRIYEMYDRDAFFVKTTRGYYGEEVDCVLFEFGFHKFIKDLEYLNSSSNEEKLKFLLKKEYSYLLEDFINFSILEVPFKDLVPVENMRYVDVSSYSWDTNLPIGIYCKTRSKFKMIDGRHRWQIMRDKEPINVKIIVCEY